MFCKNVGTADRLVRLLMGLAAIGVAFFILDAAKGSVAGIIALAAGGVMVLTAALGFCPLYVPLKVSTCKPA